MLLSVKQRAVVKHAEVSVSIHLFVRCHSGIKYMFID